MANTRFHLILAALLTTGGASPSEISGPISGWVFDALAKSVRPVLGIPGAAVLGDGLDLGYPLADAAVAPEQNYVITVAADGTVRLVRPAAQTAQVFETLHGAPQRVAFSPRGSSALLLNSTTLDVYTGLPDKPALARTLDLSAIGTPAGIAVSDDGNAVLALADGRVYVAGEAAEWNAIESAEAFAFAPGSRDAALAGPSGEVRLLNEVTAGGERKVFAPSSEGAAVATAVSFTATGRIVVAQDRTISVFDPSTAAGTSLACDCSSTSLSRMGGAIRLNDISAAPMWLLDAAGDEARLVFVPAPVSRRPGLPQIE